VSVGRAVNERGSAPGAKAPAGDIRCGCGALVARLLRGGVELKCRRCRRRLVLTIGADGSVAVDGTLVVVAGSDR
jgi:hypothetical protein